MKECELGLIEHKYVKPPHSYFFTLWLMKPKEINLRDDTLERWEKMLDLKVCEYCGNEWAKGT